MATPHGKSAEPTARSTIAQAPMRRLAGAAAGAILIVLAVVLLIGWDDIAGTVHDLNGNVWAKDIVSRFGPFAVVVLLAVAVVAAPIPSGPVAIAAGALYGVWLGGWLTAAGAFLGAMIAFGLSRRFGHAALRNSSQPVAVWITRPRSPTMLMAVVFLSRLVPLISFDAVSYLAGLTPLAAWRFALATLSGVIPASFAFAAMGADMTGGGTHTFAVAACFVTLLLPAALIVLRKARQYRDRRRVSD